MNGDQAVQTFPPAVNNKPGSCAYAVRYWMEGAGWCRHECEADDAVSAGVQVKDFLSIRFPGTEFVIVNITRK